MNDETETLVSNAIAEAPREPKALVRQCFNCAEMCAVHPCYPGCEDGVLAEPPTVSNVIPFPVRNSDQPPVAPPTRTLDSHAAAMLRAALAYAEAGWQILPLGRKKKPRIPSPHPEGPRCKGECGQDGHGFHDATSDPATILRWWGIEYPGSNIGVRPPPTVFVLDTDPRKRDHPAAMEIMARYGPLPHTLITLSGRRDGGLHRFYRKPPGDLAGQLLIPGFEELADTGIDLKGHGALVVGAGSIHHRTGLPYIEVDAPIAECPDWLAPFVIKPPPPKPSTQQRFFTSGGSRCPSEISPADWYTDNHSWSDVLLKHGWTPISGTGDDDGDSWRHPTATADTSATISNGGLLFVYSTSTVFEPTYGGNPNGYTRFRAYAELNHHGDLAAAAKAIREKGM